MLRWAGIESRGELASACVFSPQKTVTDMRSSFFILPNFSIPKLVDQRRKCASLFKCKELEIHANRMASQNGRAGKAATTAQRVLFSHTSLIVFYLITLRAGRGPSRSHSFFFSLIAKANNDDPSFRADVFLYFDLSTVLA